LQASYQNIMGGPCTVDGQVRQELDNFHCCQVEMDGEFYPSSEHAFQAAKYPQNQEQRNRIREAASGIDSWQMGQTRSADFRSDWEGVKVEMMYRANLSKFTLNPQLRDLLVKSQGAITAQGGFFWKTWNEVLLERIREELRGDLDRDEAVLAHRKAAMAAYAAAAAATEMDKHAVEVVTKYASERRPIPEPSSDSTTTLIVAGAGSELDGVYKLDLLQPEANGVQHFSNHGAGHLCLGSKHGRSAWVLDQVFSPSEASGQAFIPAQPDAALPVGQLLWQCFDDNLGRHVEQMVSIQVGA